MNGTGWKVITSTPYNELMEDVSVIKNIMKVTFLICLIITFILSIIISGRISSKLVKMKMVVDSVKKGNLDKRIHVSGSDEVAELGEGFNSMLLRLNHLIDKEYTETLLRKEAELNLLQSQINPHFLYNTLGSIKSLAKEEGAEKAAVMIQSLSNIFRYNLGREKSIVTIKEELENTKNYLQLQQYRFDEKIKIVYDIDQHILNEKILIMTLQPIIENSIVHGFEPKQSSGILTIRGFYSNNSTIIEVVDDGVGIDKDKIDQLNDTLANNSQCAENSDRTRIGICNVNSRIKYRFGSLFGLRIYRNEVEGVRIVITLPREADKVETLP